MTELNESQNISIKLEDAENSKSNEFINPFLIQAKQHLFNGNFDKAEELVVIFLNMLTEPVIEKIDDIILKQFIIKITTELNGNFNNINVESENERLLLDFLNYSTDDNAFTGRGKFILPKLSPLLPKYFVDAHPNAPEIALDFLKYTNLFSCSKLRRYNFKYTLECFITGIEIKNKVEQSYFFDGLLSFIGQISKNYEKKNIKCKCNDGNLLRKPLMRNELTNYIKAIFSTELNESGCLTILLDDKKFINELRRVNNLLEKKDFVNLSLIDKLHIVQILEIFISEMELTNDVYKKLEDDCNIPQNTIKKKLQDKQKLERKIVFLEKEIKSTKAGKVYMPDEGTLESVISIKKEGIDNAKEEVDELNSLCLELEDKKKFGEFFFWNKSPNILGKDRMFNIYKLSIGFDFICVMKPKNAKYTTIREEYSKTFKKDFTIDDELIAKLSPVTKMKCDGYEYFYIDNITTFKEIISMFDNKGARERELLKEMNKIMDLVEHHIEAHKEKITK
ncbi:Hypothetical protein SRAE_2000240900 [Strongyloides ratti]|uniref:WSD domain-containing protein n=1 Tax=Strongyloides ratti TaxID=34506 RepID=A0A090LHZ5_STRRB|nr:Hypothetical protein SRAE_2000240900 [Strongyloides ratti]CEF67748.1 Hypothetical protein SRAE_2000240900 [Strongyloides ratti]